MCVCVCVCVCVLYFVIALVVSCLRSCLDGKKRETTYQQNNCGFGTSAAFKLGTRASRLIRPVPFRLREICVELFFLDFEEGTKYVIIPFAKVPISGDFAAILYSHDKDELSISELPAYKHSVSVEVRLSETSVNFVCFLFPPLPTPSVIWSVIL